MKRVDARNLGPDDAARLMAKPPFDAVRLGDGAQARIRETFGADLSAAEAVERIVGDVRKTGDEAVVRYTRLIDGPDFTGRSYEVTEAELTAAYEVVSADDLRVIRRAIENVRRFHTEQIPRSWMTYRENGAILGQACLPLDRVGIYVPGGTAAYPSSVVMNAAPAVVAGVKEIIMTVPPDRTGGVNPYVLAAAREAGVTRVFKAGGAQAISALAFGTATVPKVDKITGPGNIFVTLAKKAVYGHCDIDMLAGPSEICIIADHTADARHLAADLLSQAEHDVLASSVLISNDAGLIDRVEAETERQLALLPRRSTAAEALARNGMLVLAADLTQAAELANAAAPEHLEIITADPFAMLPAIRHAGAVFLGPYSPEPLGDYMAGPNHVLPTGGTARFYSVLNVESFMKKTSVISYTKQALAGIAADVVRLAEIEGLAAHANAVRVRIDE